MSREQEASPSKTPSSTSPTPIPAPPSTSLTHPVKALSSPSPFLVLPAAPPVQAHSPAAAGGVQSAAHLENPEQTPPSLLTTQYPGMGPLPPPPAHTVRIRVCALLKNIRKFILCTSLHVALKKWTTGLKNLDFFLAVHCLHIHNHKSILQRYLCC